MAEMATLQVRKYSYDSGEFPRTKKELAAVPKPVKKPQPLESASSNTPAPAGGSGAPAAGNTPSSSSQAPAMSGWQEYRGTGFSVSYPQGWQAEGSGADVTMAPRDPSRSRLIVVPG